MKTGSLQHRLSSFKTSILLHVQSWRAYCLTAVRTRPLGGKHTLKHVQQPSSLHRGNHLSMSRHPSPPLHAPMVVPFPRLSQTPGQQQPRPLMHPRRRTQSSGHSPGPQRTKQDHGRRKPKVTVLASSMGRNLATELNQRGHVDCYGSTNSSATAENLTAKAADVVRINDPDYVVLMAGTNNISNGERPRDVISKMDSLAKECKANNCDATVVVSSILHRTDKPELNRNITVINRVLRQKAEESGFVFMNSNAKISPSHLRRDGLHLNREGVTVMAQTIENTVKDLKETQSTSSHAPFHQGHQQVVRQEPIPVVLQPWREARTPCFFNPRH